MKVTAPICSPRSAAVRSRPAARTTPRYVIPFSFTKSGQHRGAEYPGPVVLSVPQAARSAAPTSGDSQQARDFRPIIDNLPFRNTFMPQRATPVQYDIRTRGSARFARREASLAHVVTPDQDAAVRPTAPAGVATQCGRGDWSPWQWHWS